ncbi:hypothetical protein [Pseudobacteriovorax antillogorgiicola]|uniref:Uncharacterized protein n=1 Tax=Pseudobacteriovorax antillogorgiicola TaxID=1513793 RepID=A0A1Y6BW98_9BACT|nr:hypothetical protein [Pseudobacteriovorax antillogorgiicola]TCS52466.1 hypothetical protein EDD56_109211 [Pseudobacteriovorax antillogorgiicola]SMF28407.1 hypothetical protein SAMN06296036_1094 [Pseudobacteriovorax antillogorgiicola]
MAGQFDAKQYVEKWDRVIIPVMLVAIVGSIVAVFALNSAASPECKRHEYTFCGTEAVSHHGDDHH